MTAAVPDILARIVGRKQEELTALRPRLPALEKLAAARIGLQRGFRRALLQRPPAIIAEVKKASPSKGLLAADFRPVETALAYQSGGAAALSVLTDQDFFQGSLEDLENVRAAITLPVLRKDFTLEEAHVIQAAAHGADAILLIAALHDAPTLRRLREFAFALGLDVLVEVHDVEELARVLDSGADLIGVNNRDLRSFEVRLETSLRLAERIPSSALRVSESGIFTAHDVASLQAAGYVAFLVGESLMKSPDPASALRSLLA